MEIVKLFSMMVKHNASDLHVKVGQPPVFRVSGQLSRMQNVSSLEPDQTQQLLEPLLSEDQLATLRSRGNVDFAWYQEDVGRFRCNIFLQRGYLSAAIRKVNLEIPSYEQLGLPADIAKVAEYEAGLVLIGGVTGSGKSTTLASILSDINNKRRCHILTIEDPIEYLFHDNLAIINQREIGIDVMDFKDALRAAVRQDPDVMLVGEMRDAETFETALTAAETGHLVFGTVHSSGAAQTIGRILDLFPEEKHEQIRTGLGFNLRAVLNQKLLRAKDKAVGRVPAVETMFNTPIVRKLILEGEDNRLHDAIKADTDNGCRSFNQVLAILVKQGKITQDVALKAAPNAEELRMAMSGIVISDAGGIV
ncbi:MAG: PilT/PilU family type 4a pilus ATPase [Planctomycetota bacterium]|jgi:twitching motility protein PilT|nr:PilT/PilU family type 4a pilus ATPase [Planctomycetota bacterium]